MKKHISDTVLIAAAMTISLFITGIISAYDTERHIEESVVRLHILADSDSAEDQRLKLIVRDEILAHSGELFRPYSSSEEAADELNEQLDKIESIAENVLLRNGCVDNVHAEITDMDIDERIYGDYTVPAGEYTALRVTIGSGEGKNWWCVMYPPLCVPCADADISDEEIMEIYGGELTDADMDMLSRGADFKIRLYIVELIKRLLSE